MNILYFLLPLSLLMGLIFLIAFIWAVKKGQLDDLETPAHRMLFDDKKYLNQKVLSTEEQQNE